MTYLVEMLQDMLRTMETKRGEGFRPRAWFDGYKAGLENAIRTIQMGLRLAAGDTPSALSKYQVLGNIKDVNKPSTRGLVDGNKLLPGDIVQLYKHGTLFVDERGCFTWLVTEPPKMIKEKEGAVKMTRLRFDVLKNLHKFMKLKPRTCSSYSESIESKDSGV